MKNAAVGLALFVALILATRGCGGYAEVSPLTFQHAKALYAACNSRQTQRLETCAAMVAEAESSQQISTTEARYLRDIIATGKSEQWAEAQAMARKLMTDQAGL